MWIAPIILAATASLLTETAGLTPEQALRVRRISDLQLSPDGRRVTFTVQEPAVGTETNRDVWVLDVENGETRPFASSEKSDHHPRWSPDGKLLAFLSDRNEESRIYLLPTDGGEARALTEGASSIRIVRVFSRRETYCLHCTGAQDRRGKGEGTRNVTTWSRNWSSTLARATGSGRKSIKSIDCSGTWIGSTST